MINVDLSKVPSLKITVYLLALFPGLFLLVSIALGNPKAAESMVSGLENNFSLKQRDLLPLLLGAGFAFGHALILLSWWVESIVILGYRCLWKIYRKIVGSQRVYVWFSKFQGVPPRRNLLTRLLGKFIFTARIGDHYLADSRAVRACLGVATETLLKRRYGIGSTQANGPNGEWQVWYSVVGKPLKHLVAGMNAGRTTLACGLAGFVAVAFAPRLNNRYFLTMSFVFTLGGLWTPLWYFIRTKSPGGLDWFRLRSVIEELRELPPNRGDEEDQNAA